MMHSTDVVNQKVSSLYGVVARELKGCCLIDKSQKWSLDGSDTTYSVIDIFPPVLFKQKCVWLNAYNK